MWVAELWRYPVNSMAGEPLQRARLTPAGVGGDRIVQVRDAGGRTVTARTHPGLLRFRATLDSEIAVREVVGPGAQLVHHDVVDRFDILPLLVATDGAIAEFGRDRRRLRPNIVVSGVTGLVERQWQRGHLIVDDVDISVHD